MNHNCINAQTDREKLKEGAGAEEPGDES